MTAVRAQGAAARAALVDERGFSLVEMLVVAAVVGTLMAGVTLLQQQSVQAYVAGSNRVETQQNARVVVEMISRELRTARSITTVGSSTNLTFVNQDGVTIQYTLAGTTLSRVAAGVSRTLASGVTSFTMTCYSTFDVSTGTYTTTTTPAQVRVVRFDVAVRTQEASGGNNVTNQQASMQSTVMLRSLM